MRITKKLYSIISFVHLIEKCFLKILYWAQVQNRRREKKVRKGKEKQGWRKEAKGAGS